MANNDRLGWLVGAAGLTGSLIALGYVVRIAQADLLGVSTYDPERAGYLLAAGDLIIHGIISLLDWPALVALIVGILLVLALEFGRRRSPRFYAARSFLSLAVVLFCAGHLLFFVLPTFPIRNLLFQSVCLDRQFEVSPVVHWRTEAVWKQVICSRVSGTTIPACGLRSPQKYQDDLEYTFSVALLTAGLLCVSGWRILHFAQPPPDSKSRWAVPWVWSRTLLLISLFLTLFGLAYLYGKTVKSTTFPSAAIDFGASGNPAVTSQSSAQEEPQEFLLIADNGTTTVLYNLDIHHERVWVVRDATIERERISSLDDILKRRIGNQKSSCVQEVPVR